MNRLQRKEHNKKRGFTLIELLVSITIFSIVLFIAMGALLAVINSSRKAKTIKSVVNNLHVAIEGMSREIRVGYDYTCGANQEDLSDIITGGDDCISGENSIGFRTKENGSATYILDGAAIKRHLDESGVEGGRDDGGWLSITTDSITIDKLKFTVVGANGGNSVQPRVMIRIGGEATIENFTTRFDIQTTVSQRRLSP